MLLTGQVPGRVFGETPDVLAMLRSRYAPDDGGQDGGDGGTGGSGSGAGAGASGDGGQTGKDGTPFDATRAQRTIDSLREKEKAGAQAAKERDELAQRLKAIEDKDKTDSEKLAGDLKSTTDKLTQAEQRAMQAETRYKDALIRSAIDREAHKGNAVDADAVYALVDRSGIEIDEGGNVAGADKAVTALLKAKPYLVGASGGTGGVKSIGGSREPTGDQSDEERVKSRAQEQRKGGLFSGF